MNDPIVYDYDWENYPNFSCVTFYREQDNARWYFEISQWVNQGKELNYFLNQLRLSNGIMEGFNNVGYDYPVTHYLMMLAGRVTPATLYNKGQTIIRSDKRFEHVIWERDRLIPQRDLMLVHHFDNKAKATSLKALEFAMRMNDIQELPFDPSLPLTYEQSRFVAAYNWHDVKATHKFGGFSKNAVAFREELSRQYGVDFTNFNDTKIGATIVEIELKKSGVKVNRYTQTHRSQIRVADVIFDYIRFDRPEFQQTLEFFRNSVIDPEKIKGFFKNGGDDEAETKFTSVDIDGFTFDFGAGGIHGSIKNSIVESNDTHVLLDVDVASYYPNIGIKNKLYPAHLGPAWYETLDFMFHERIRVGKKTDLGNAYKLGLNGTYGKSNDKFSPFLDPQYTMAITINGQLMLCMLAEQLMKIPGLKMVQANTDGITYLCPREYVAHCMKLNEWWEQLTQLELETNVYSKMCIRDVNSYIAVKAPYSIKDGQIVDDPDHAGVKRIGAYAYVRVAEDDSTRELPWHKNHSAIVVAKAAEAALVYGQDIRTFITNHVTVDPFDFYLRAKVPRSARLIGVTSSKKGDGRPYVENLNQMVMYDGDVELANITRYYVANSGLHLVKIMKPTALQVENWNTQPHWQHVDSGKTKCAKKAPSGKWQQIPKPSEMPPLREIGIDSGWLVRECNKLDEDSLSLFDVNIDYYVKQAEKLVKDLV